MSTVEATQWPNQQEIVDGVTPVEEVSQEPYLFSIGDDDTDVEMDN